MPKRKIFLFGLFCLLCTGTVLGQFQTFKDYSNWKQVSTDYFDVLYKDNDSKAASRVARYAEEIRFDLGVLFDFKPTERYTLIYFNDANELFQSNQTLEPQRDQPGTVQFVDPLGRIVHQGSNEALYAAVKRETARLILQEFAYGTRLGSMVQTDMLQHSPDWYWEGLLEYVATGWTYEDEMWMTSIRNEDLLELALEGDQHINRVVRKSVWHFITHEYGEPKISEIVYLVNIARSVESGIISVLGISLHTLTERWREYTKVRYSTQMQRRVSWDDMPGLSSVPQKEGYRVLSAAAHNGNGQVALFLEKMGKQSIWLYDLETGDFEESPIRMGYARQDARFVDFEPALAWHPNGNKLVTTIYEGKELQIVYWTPGSKDYKSQRLDGGIDKVMDLSWSPDGQKIAVSALHDGRTDIFLVNNGQSNLKALTDDAFDDRYPTWSQDNLSVFFSSNRDTTSLDIPHGAWESHATHFDLFRFDLEANVVLRLTRTPETNEIQPIAISGFELAYLSDETGVYNFHQVNIFTGERLGLSNLAVGAIAAQLSEEQVMVISSDHGQKTIYLFPLQNLQPGTQAEPTMMRVEYVSAFFEEERKKEKVEEAISELLQPAQPEPQQPESPVVEEKEEPVHYYIFDEEEEPYEARQLNLEDGRPSVFAQPKLPPPTIFGNQAKPVIEEVVVDNMGQAETKWKADYLGLNWNFDPVAMYGFRLNTSFSDVLEHQKVMLTVAPFVFSNNGTDASLTYEYKPMRMDFFAEAGYFSRQFRRENNLELDSLIFRYDQVRLNGGVRYPISSFASVEGSIGAYYIDRKDQQLLRQTPLSTSDGILRAGLGFRFDKTLEKEGFTYQGWKGNLFVDSYYSIAQRNMPFTRLQGEVRNYLNFYRNIVLATRLASAFNLPNQQVQYYMGGTNERFFPPISFQREDLEGRSNTIDTSLHSFHFQQFLMPVRGFRPNARQGTRYVMGSAELRLPLTRMARSALNSKALYNVELIPFIDVGTVWVDGNPFSDKNPTDTQILTNGPVTVKLQTLKSPFLVGFGTGLRATIIGYSLRFDLAWGVDDGTLRPPMLMTSVGKNF
jgi:hypothetical protein